MSSRMNVWTAHVSFCQCYSLHLCCHADGTEQVATGEYSDHRLYAAFHDSLWDTPSARDRVYNSHYVSEQHPKMVTAM